MVVRSIERGTRWVVGAGRDPVARRRVVEQLEQFFSALAEAGAFPNAPGDRPYAAVCDERVNSAADLALGNVHILVHFAALHPGEFHGYMITHHPQGSTAMPVAVNTLELPGMPLEIELDDEEDDDDLGLSLPQDFRATFGTR
jgi:phage tail sheath protein FI